MFCLVLVFDIGYAQKVNNRLKADINLFHDELFAQPHWEFIIAPNITQKAILTHNNPSPYLLKTAPQISGEIGILRIFHFDRHNSIEIGLKYGISGRNGSFVVPYSAVGYSFEEDYIFNKGMAQVYDIEYFSLPLTYEHRILYKKHRGGYINIGINARIVFSGGTVSGDENILEINVEGNKKPVLNFNAGGGYIIVLKNNNLLKLGLTCNLDPSWLTKGFYDFRTLVSRDYGSYTVKGSSIGLAISYVLTRYNKLRPLQGIGKGN